MIASVRSIQSARASGPNRAASNSKDKSEAIRRHIGVTLLRRRYRPSGVYGILHAIYRGKPRMKLVEFNTLLCSVVLAAALAAPGVALAQDTSTPASNPVTCKDGTTSPHGGRGACSGHGGIDKSASAGSSTAAPAAAAAPAASAAAAAPAASGSPSSSGATTVTCKDGTTSTHSGRGACSGHGGVN